MDFSVHQLGHELSARFDVSHGASLSAMWGWWAETCLMSDVHRFERYAQKVWVVKEAREGIEKSAAYFRELGMPSCFTELGIGILPEEDILELASRCAWRGKRKIGQLKPLDTDGIAAVYRLANV
jgi:hypothetical protein